MNKSCLQSHESRGEDQDQEGIDSLSFQWRIIDSERGLSETSELPLPSIPVFDPEKEGQDRLLYLKIRER